MNKKLYNFVLGGTHLLFYPTVINKEALDNSEVVVLAGNHVSMLDPLYILATVGKKKVFTTPKVELTLPFFKYKTLKKAEKLVMKEESDLTKKELKLLGKSKEVEKLIGSKMGIFGHVLTGIDSTIIDRENIGRDILLEMVNKVDSGMSMIIFPEGTRVKEGEPEQKFHAGAVWVAKKANVPILPFNLNYNEDAFILNSKKRVVLNYGNPYIPDANKKVAREELEYKIKSLKLN